MDVRCPPLVSPDIALASAVFANPLSFPFYSRTSCYAIPNKCAVERLRTTMMKLIKTENGNKWQFQSNHRFWMTKWKKRTISRHTKHKATQMRKLEKMIFHSRAHEKCVNPCEHNELNWIVMWASRFSWLRQSTRCASRWFYFSFASTNRLCVYVRECEARVPCVCV